MRVRSILATGLTAALSLSLVIARPAPAWANSGTLWVNDDGIATPTGSSCENPNFNAIQPAVAAASPDTRINVCPGTYTEQVTIPAGKNGIKLRSVRVWQAIIKAPAVMLTPKAIVLVSTSRDVQILAFTITGPGAFGCDSLEYGVRVDSGGSADILGNHITKIEDTPFSGCQNGVAVQVGRFAEATTGSANIIGNVIDNYQKNGPTVSNTGSSAQIAYNRVLGAGPTATIAQNGVQVSGGATATVRHNFVAGNVYTGALYQSTGILLFAAGAVVIDHNTAPFNDSGVYIYQTNATLTSDNRVRASTYDGIVVDLANSGRVTDNRSDQNSGPGVGLYDGSQSNKIDENKVEDNSGGGILLDVADNNTVSNNKVKENGTNSGDTTDGIRINTGSGNIIDGNKLRDNLTHDCHDNSYPANTWTDNRGETSLPPSLCGRDDQDSDFETSTNYGWDSGYAWSTGYDGAADFDWAAAYATVNTDSLMQLLPQVALHARSVPSSSQ
jgi:parallel beta-helix repeat protein